MNQKRYSGVAMLLHWTIAIAVIANWRIADSAEGLPDAERAAVMANHMALGIVILVLTLARLAWRIAKKPPPFAASVKPWEARLAHITHVVFYALLIGLPLGGWLATSFYGRGIGMWGLFAVPALPVAADENLGQRPARFASDEAMAKLDRVRAKYDPDGLFNSWMGRI